MIVQCGREIKSYEISQIRETVRVFRRLSRTELVQTVCEHLDWKTASGSNKEDACLKLLKRLEAQGVIQLPGKRKVSAKLIEAPQWTDRSRPQVRIDGKLSQIQPIKLRVARNKEDKSLINEYISRYHYLGYKKPFGCHLRYFVEGGGSLLGCMIFSGAAKALNLRDQWIGWKPDARLKNLGYVINNGRFLIFPWVKVKNLASHTLGKLIIVIGEHWRQHWNYQPVLLETFVDPRYFDGTCYRAANFKYLGMTSGTGLVREGKNYTTNPKKIFVYPLVDNFRQVLSSRHTTERSDR